VDVTVSDPMVGQLLDGRYRVGRRIARGGMAMVYEAVDTRLHRTVALKVLHASLVDDADFVRRFHREARSAAGLSHPHIVAVFDQGEHEGTPYLTMEYVAGQTLRTELSRRGRFDPHQALFFLDIVLQALAAAHAAGIVHRDVKPENVLLGNDGSVKVADFGLARAVSAATSTATQGMVIGTVSYLAPEQLTHGPATARGDVYATGIMLYEMLVGSKPHEGDSPIQVAYKHVNEDVPAPSERVPGIPAYVDGLVKRATARDPNLRPADAREFLRLVRRARAALANGEDDPQLVRELALPPTVAHQPLQVRLPQAPDRPRATNPPAVAAAPVRQEHTMVAPLPEVAAPPRYAGPYRAARYAGPYAEDEDPSSLTPPPWWRRISVITTILLGLLVLVGGFCWVAAVGPFTKVPHVINVAEGRLDQMGRQHGVTFQVAGERHHEKIPKGHVIETSPLAGTRVVRGATVQVWISRGPERYEVPQVQGMTEQRARQLIRDSKLDLAPVQRVYSETVKRGRVIRTSPRAGTPLPPGSMVTLVVSKGRQPVNVPPVLSVNVDQATEFLESYGFKVTVEEEFSNDVPQDTVISQDPEANTTAFRGDTVKLVVSKGPEKVVVPEVVGKGEQEAIQILTEKGLKVEVRHSPIYLGRNVVANQSPAAGQEVPAGTTIVLETI